MHYHVLQSSIISVHQTNWDNHILEKELFAGRYQAKDGPMRHASLGLD